MTRFKIKNRLHGVIFEMQGNARFIFNETPRLYLQHNTTKFFPFAADLTLKF